MCSKKKNVFGAKTTRHITQRTTHPQGCMVVAALCFGAVLFSWKLVQGGGNYEHFQIVSFGTKASIRKLKMKRKFTFQHNNTTIFFPLKDFSLFVS